MRQIAVAMVLLVSCLFALPACAQQTRGYQPPNAEELSKLDKGKSAELRKVRAGKSLFGRPLSAHEQRVLDKFAKEHPEAYERLKDLRGGRVSVHVHWWDDWGMFLIIPGASCTAALIVLLVLLLIL